MNCYSGFVLLQCVIIINKMYIHFHRCVGIVWHLSHTGSATITLPFTSTESKNKARETNKCKLRQMIIDDSITIRGMTIWIHGTIILTTLLLVIISTAQTFSVFSNWHLVFSSIFSNVPETANTHTK